MHNFIAIEGIDGCGKTTQVKMLAEYFNKNKKKAIITHEPWEKGFKKIIQEFIKKNPEINDPVLDAHLFAADRILHFNKLILPALKKNTIVVCDRYIYSAYAYQKVQGLSLEWLELMNFSVPRADICFLIDCNPETAFKRVSKKIKSQKKGFAKYENVSDLKKIRKSYKELCKKYPEIVVINGNKKPEEVHKELLKHLK